MSAVLVLLALLSLATLASRRGGTTAFLNMATAPVLVGFGLLVSPQGLGFVLPSLLQGVVAPLHVAVAWLALLVGLRGQRPRGWAFVGDVMLLLAWTLLTGGCAAVVCAGAWELLAWMEVPGTAVVGEDALAWTLVMAALVTGSGSHATQQAVTAWKEGVLRRRLLFLAHHDDVLGVLALLAVPFLLHVGTAPMALDAAVWLPLGAGLLLAACALLVGVAARTVTAEARMGLVALVVVAGGLCAAAGIPEAPSAFLMGAVLALAGVGGRVLGDHRGETYDRPVRLAVLLVAGTLVQVNAVTLLLGAALFVGRLAGKLLVAATAGRRDGQRVSPSVLLASAGLTVPLALSVLLTGAQQGAAALVFSAVVWCVCFTDLLSFAWSFSTWMQDTKGRAITLPRLARQEGSTP